MKWVVHGLTYQLIHRSHNTQDPTHSPLSHGHTHMHRLRGGAGASLPQQVHHAPQDIYSQPILTSCHLAM